MKRLLLVLFFVLPMLAFARNAMLFRYDAHKLSLQMAAVNQLDRYVEAQHAMDGTIDVNSRLWSGYRTWSLPNQDKEKTWGSSSFILGCLFGAIGVLIVYLITESSEEVRKAVWGMVSSFVITGACVGLLLLTSASITIILGD